MADVAPVGSGTVAERQVVGICLRYAGAAETTTLSKDDFSAPWLGRLFEACKLLPEPPAPPGPRPDVDPSEWATTPVPEEWLAWATTVEHWRPRQAARMVMVDPFYAVELYEPCSCRGTLPRWAREVSNTILLRRYRLACADAIRLADEGARPEEVKAALSGMV